MAIDQFLNQNTINQQLNNLKDTANNLAPVAQNFAGDLGGIANKYKDQLSDAMSPLFGKAKRMGNSLLKQVPDGVLEITKRFSSAQITNTSGTIDPKDWRVGLSIPPRLLEYMYSGSSTLLDPLKATNNRLVFPYTPTVLVGHSAIHNPMQPVHTNYPYYAYENSRVDQMTITADFYVQNEFEAKYWVAAIHFLRAITKMNYGQGPDKGQPPPVVFLNGYGDFTFNNVPVLVTNFQFDLKREVDYISTNLTPGGTATGDMDQGYSNGTSGYAWAPTESLITVGVVPQYSRTKQSQFNLKEFVKGTSSLKGDGFI